MCSIRHVGGLGAQVGNQEGQIELGSAGMDHLPVENSNDLGVRWIYQEVFRRVVAVHYNLMCVTQVVRYRLQ